MVDEVINDTNNDWALDKTLQGVIEVLQDILKVTEEQAKKVTRAAATNDPKKLKESVEEVINHGKAARDTSKRVTTLGKSIKANTTQFDALYKAQLSVASAMQFAQGMLSGLAAGIWSTGKELFKLSLDLERSGLGASLVSYGDGLSTKLGAIAQGANQTNLALGTFSKIVKEYSQAIGTYGVKRFSVNAGIMSENMRQFGVTNVEATEYLAKYLEQQRKMGLFEKLSTAQSARNAQDSMRQTIGLANAMKLSREEIEKRMKAAEEAPDAQFLINQLSSTIPDIQNQYRMISAAMGTETANMVLSAAHAATFTGTAMASTQVQELLTQGAVQTAGMVAQLGTALSSGNMSLNHLTNVQEQIRNGALDHDKQITGVLRDQASGARRVIVAFDAMAGTFEAVNYSDAKVKADEASIRTVEFFNVMQQIKGAFQTFVLALVNNPEIVASMKWLAEHGVPIIESFLTDFRTTLEGFMDGGKRKGLVDGIFGAFGGAILGFGGVLLAALAAPGLTMMIASGTIRAFGGLIGGVVGLTKAGLMNKGTGVPKNARWDEKAQRYRSTAKGTKGQYVKGTNPAKMVAAKKAATKLAAKSAGKMIPGLGMLIAGGEMAYAAKEGDWAGVGISALGGLASFIPLAGGALSVAIGAANATRMALRDSEKQEQVTKPSEIEERNRQATDVKPPEQPDKTENAFSMFEKKINSIGDNPTQKEMVVLLDDIRTHLGTIAKNTKNMSNKVYG